MQSTCLLLALLVPCLIAAPIETNTPQLQINIQHMEPEAQAAHQEIERLNEAIDQASSQNSELNAEAIHTLVDEVNQQLENVHDEKQADGLRAHLDTVLQHAAEVLPENAPVQDVIHDAMEASHTESEQAFESSTNPTIVESLNDATDAHTPEVLIQAMNDDVVPVETKDVVEPSHDDAQLVYPEVQSGQPELIAPLNNEESSGSINEVVTASNSIVDLSHDAVNTAEVEAQPADSKTIIEPSNDAPEFTVSATVFHPASDVVESTTSEVLQTNNDDVPSNSNTVPTSDATESSIVEVPVVPIVIPTHDDSEVATKVEVLPVLAEVNDTPSVEGSAEAAEEHVEVIQTDLDRQNDPVLTNENNDNIYTSPSHEDKTSEIIFADPEHNNQLIDIESVDPMVEQLTINVPLRFTVDEILGRLNKKVFKSPFNERLYIAMKLTEMSHSLMRSVDNEMDEKKLR